MVTIIKIPVKKGLSNKTQTQAKTALLHGDTSPPTGPKPASELIPFIDKISVVVTPKTKEDQADIHQAVATMWNDKELLGPATWKKPYKRSYTVPLEGFDDEPRFDYSFHGPLATKLRFELNPGLLGKDGMNALHASLIVLMPDGWEYALVNGNISRLDVAVDLHAVRMDDFLYLPTQSTRKLAWTSDGHLESFTLGTNKGHQTLVYNKKAEQKAKGKKWDGSTVVRIEKRMKNLNSKVLDLGKLENPFKGTLLVQNFPPPIPDENQWQWTLFQDCVRFRGLDKALALLPKDRKAKYRKHLKAHSLTWWDAEMVWANWPQALGPLMVGNHVFFKQFA
ncbi:replication initiation factor domain-containing protein [Aurantimonas sp. 22II-16-19i]|uniref:replication initiation factor domain-containing protein n=1 Tax=Aurantimonas sp. 22II-16-19i TaxID=1317114 RepID=UPI00111C7ED4|nr:replication initiation factor domain-containing protein [Aurantimonas sp. 22II-16-19i]